MTHTSMTGWGLATTLSLAAALAIQPGASAQTEAIQVEIPNPGKTGLVPGRYRVELGLMSAAAGKDHEGHIELISVSTPATRQRSNARITGCGSSAIAKLSWTPRVVSRPDGSLQLDLVAKSAPGCRIAATVPAAPVPGIEGTPIGTAGAPAQKTPGIEGTPIGTAGAPRKPGGRGRTGTADSEIEQAIIKARRALPRVACPNAPHSIQARFARLQSSLKEVATASSPAAAVPALRQFDAARQTLYKSLAGDRAFAAEAARCADAERRCTASGSVGNGCGIEAAVCLAVAICGQR